MGKLFHLLERNQLSSATTEALR